MRDIAVIGVGNAHRGDDAAGIGVVERVRDLAAGSLQTFQSEGDVTQLMDLFQSFRVVYLVDALVSSAAEPGTVIRIEGNTSCLSLGRAQSSTHVLGLGELIELARLLGALPKKLVIFAINGRHFGMGDEMSREVCEAVSAVTDAILRETLGAKGECEAGYA